MTETGIAVDVLVRQRDKAQTRVAVLFALVVALVAALVLGYSTHERAMDRLADEYHCFLDDRPPIAIGPNTGLTCESLLAQP